MYLQTGTVATHCELGGAGSEVVFIHGHAIDARQWDPQWEPFCARHRCLRYDLRGHGRSSAPPGDYSLDRFAADLEILLNRVGFERPALIGLSFGGLIAMELALSAPQRVRGLVLVDTALEGFAYSEAYRRGWRAVRQAARRDGVRRALEQAWLSSELFRPLRGQPARFEQIRRMAQGYSGVEYLHDRSRREPAQTVLHRLQQIRCPTLVLTGERDSDDFHAIATLIGEKISGARRLVIRGAGHLSCFENPAAFNPAVLDFLADLP
ncbi:MAG TPA: alpha/beta fold hydrolase [Acidobacteriota bacterium]